MIRSILPCVLTVLIFECAVATKTPSLATSTLGGSVPARPPQTWADYTYTPPVGWTGTAYPDGIVYASPVYESGERCQLTLFQTRPAAGDLAEDTFRVYRDLFEIDPRQNSSYPFPAPTFARGTSAQGWPFFLVQKAIGGYVGDSAPRANTFVLLAQLQDRRAVIVGSSKDPLVSRCFGLLSVNVWPAFYHSLQFRGWRPVPRSAQDLETLVGTWVVATGSSALQYRFDNNGRYADSAAFQSGQTASDEGDFAIEGNIIAFRADKASQVTRRPFRLLEQSDDLGRSWSDRLCVMTDGQAETCYTRQ
jgi:hypothetical protein